MLPGIKGWSQFSGTRVAESPDKKGHKIPETRCPLSVGTQSMSFELRASAPAGWPALLLLSSRPCCLDAKEGQSYKMMRERETSLTKAAAETSIIP